MTDDFTSTPEAAAAYERHRTDPVDDRPTRLEVDRDEAGGDHARPGITAAERQRAYDAVAELLRSRPADDRTETYVWRAVQVALDAVDGHTVRPGADKVAVDAETLRALIVCGDAVLAARLASDPVWVREAVTKGRAVLNRGGRL